MKRLKKNQWVMISFINSLLQFPTSTSSPRNRVNTCQCCKWGGWGWKLKMCTDFWLLDFPMEGKVEHNVKTHAQDRSIKPYGLSDCLLTSYKEAVSCYRVSKLLRNVRKDCGLTDLKKKLNVSKAMAELVQRLELA